jgi:hypothetical protein
LTRVRSRRLGAYLAGTLLILAAMPGAASARDSRSLSIGAPPADANNGYLNPSSVSVPVSPDVHSTYFEVQILSTDNQNLAHTVLTITIATYAGLSLNTYYDPAPDGTDADACTPAASAITADTRVITCNYGSLEAFGERTIAVVANVDSTFDAANQPATLFSAQVTTNNENGDNQQLFTASDGDFRVQAFSANSLASWVAAGQSKHFSTSALGTTDAGNLSSTIAFTTSANEIVALTDGTNPTLFYQCPTGLICQPDYSEAVTTSGFFDDSPYFTWTLTARVPKTYTLSQGFVAHYLTNTEFFDWILFFKSKSSFCGSLEITSNGHCIKTLSLSKPVDGFSTLVVEVVMDHQGGMRL